MKQLPNLEVRLETLRTEYASASQERRREILDLVRQLKNPKACYECKEQPADPQGDHFPFCSEPCHEQYAKREYSGKNGKRRPTVHEMKKKLNEMVKKKHVDGEAK